MAKSNLAVRLMTAAVVAPLLLAIMFFAPPWGWYVVVVVATIIGSTELFLLSHPGDRVAQSVGVASAVGVSLVVYFRTTDARALLTMVFVVCVVGGLMPLWRLGEIKTAAGRIAGGIAGPLYIGGLLTTIGLLRRDLGDEGPHYVVLTLLIAWWGDTGGYFFGRFLGKTKLYEAISPKKTREGFFGSIVGSLIGAAVACLWFLPTLPLAHGLALALVGGALGQFGDLVESLLKRSTGIKDTGKIVPGHGGILDRLDAVFITSPVVYLYAIWFGPAS